MSDKIATLRAQSLKEIHARHEAGERASADADREWLLAEVERLRADNNFWRQARNDALAGGDVLKAEVERLREENRILHASLKTDFVAALRRTDDEAT